ncbi:MAG: winged helix DNA-binding protein [Clostridiales bacterium]|nr:winged helix DNA-binding protein [Clostridiales bacterium]
MAGISKKSLLAGSSVSIAEVQKQTQTTKSAVSSMFTALEKKGYVTRETDRSNRRNITVELTKEGERVLEEMDKKFTATLGKVLTQFGDENAVRLIALMNALMDILATVKEDIPL